MNEKEHTLNNLKASYSFFRRQQKITYQIYFFFAYHPFNSYIKNIDKTLLSDIFIVSCLFKEMTNIVLKQIEQLEGKEAAQDFVKENKNLKYI